MKEQNLLEAILFLTTLYKTIAKLQWELIHYLEKIKKCIVFIFFNYILTNIQNYTKYRKNYAYNKNV